MVVKDDFNGLLEESRDAERQRQAGIELAGLDCIHRLAGYAQSLRKLRLAPVTLCSQHFQPIVQRYLQFTTGVARAKNPNHKIKAK